MFTCHRCDIEQKFDNHGGRNRSGFDVCEVCVLAYGYTYAECCGCLVANGYNYSLELCARCAEDFRECYGCGAVGHIEYEMHYSERADDWYCEHCYEGDGLPGVRDYHDGAPWGLRPIGGEFGKHVFFGVEFEMVGDHDPSDVLEHLERKQLAHAENDSSLSQGMELISQPATLSEWRGVYGEEMRRALATLTARGFTMDDSDCGAHVHISRNAFTSPEHLARFAMWFQHNSSDRGCEGAAEAISGRGYSSYARTDVWKRGELAAACKNRAGYVRRMAAVNLTNSHTVEIRIWAGTDDFSETLGSIEFVAALVEMTRNMTARDCVIGGLHADTVGHFLEVWQDRFPHAWALWEDRVI